MDKAVGMKAGELEFQSLEPVCQRDKHTASDPRTQEAEAKATQGKSIN